MHSAGASAPICRPSITAVPASVIYERYNKLFLATYATATSLSNHRLDLTFALQPNNADNAAFLTHWALSQGIRLVLAQPFDAIMGGVIGGIKAFVLVSVLCAFGLLNPREEGRTRFQEDSVTAQKLAPLLKRITSPER